jgi:hypothetical protein
MGASRKFGPETIGSRFYLMPLSGRRRIALSTVAFLFLGCGITSDSSPVAPSVVAPSALAAEVFTDPPLPGHALFFTTASAGAGGMAVVTGETEVATVSLCGIQFVFQQRIGVLPSPPRNLGQASHPTMTGTTALIPPGVYPVTLVGICGVYLVYDVDFSHP